MLVFATPDHIAPKQLLTRVGKHAQMVIVLIGVTGAGKTCVGTALAEKLGWVFLDADALHGEANLNKLHDGIQLDDADRWPWLDRVRTIIAAHVAQQQPVIIACSALKNIYRRHLRISPEVVFVYLNADERVLEERLKRRRGHFMNPSLLKSQLETFEETQDDILAVDASRSPVDIVQLIRTTLHV
ncbi:MAG: gluconokinase [Nitrospira sp.]